MYGCKCCLCVKQDKLNQPHVTRYETRSLFIHEYIIINVRRKRSRRETWLTRNTAVFVSVIHGLGIRRYARETQNAGITQFIKRRPLEWSSNYSYCALVKFTHLHHPVYTSRAVISQQHRESIKNKTLNSCP